MTVDVSMVVMATDDWPENSDCVGCNEDDDCARSEDILVAERLAVFVLTERVSDGAREEMILLSDTALDETPVPVGPVETVD